MEGKDKLINKKQFCKNTTNPLQYNNKSDLMHMYSAVILQKTINKAPYNVNKFKM